MQQALIRKYATPAEFQLDLPQLASDGWMVQRVERSAEADAAAPGLPNLVVTYARAGVVSTDDFSDLGAPETPVEDARHARPRRSTSRWSKTFTGAGVAIVLFASLSAMGEGPRSTSASGDSTFTVSAVASSQVLPPPKQAPAPQALPYTQQLANITVNASVTYETVAALTGKPQLGNEAWRSQLARSLGDLKTEDASLRALTAPACLSELHSQLLEAARRLDKVADQINGAVSVESTSGVVQSVPWLVSANNLLRETTVKLQSSRC